MRLLTNDQPRKTARFIKFRRNFSSASQKALPPGIQLATPASFIAASDLPLPNAMTAAAASVNNRIAPCKCLKKDDKWFCMKPDTTGRYLMVDGPFATEAECLDLAVCE